MADHESLSRQGFNTDLYLELLTGLHSQIGLIEEDAVRTRVIEIVNNMHLLLRPVVDEYLAKHPESDFRYRSIEDLYTGQDSRG